ncbi:MAG: DUF3488 and transglutaminase-like domain-containing protein [Salinisphaeraceae bacterium]
MPTEQRLRLIAVLALVMAPHLVRVPLWVSLFTGAILGWQAMAAWRNWPAPARWLRLLLALAAFVGVYASYGRVDGQNAGVALLMLMLALKLTETHRHRDMMILLGLCYFVVITHFLFSQEIVMAVFLGLAGWLITACFIDANHPGRALPIRELLRRSAGLLAQALPLAVLLFVLFPRIPGPLWGLPSDSGASARTGLSDSMEPGSISRVALSDAVAFRVEFEGDPPPPAQRYWRGPVFWSFDGRRWTTGWPGRFVDASPDYRPQTAPVRYRLTLEPHDQDWLLALDLPARAPANAYRDAAGSLRTREPISQRRAFTLTSVPGYALQPDPPSDLLDYARQLPGDGNPRARALARQWRDRDAVPAEVVNAALTRFREQPFRYTLQPGVLRGEDRIDQFLFDTRAGFCEHYAGAFVFLMRAAGIPARVVTGYQGGSPGLGDYLIVRAADAHAWAEVWLEDRGWLRVDPTGAVAPERIEAGLGGSLGADEPVPYLARGGGDLLRRAQLAWDWANAGWNRWFLAYGPERQRDFLAGLGLPDVRSMILALTLLLTAVMALIGAILIWQARPRGAVDPVQAAWLRLCHRLAAAGLPRRDDEGPLDYAKRVARARPDCAATVGALAREYVAIRYRHGGSRQQRRAFIRDARRFRPRGAPRRPARI